MQVFNVKGVTNTTHTFRGNYIFALNLEASEVIKQTLPIALQLLGNVRYACVSYLVEYIVCGILLDMSGAS